MRTRRLGQFGHEMAGKQDTPLWMDAESGMYNFSLDGVITEEKDKNKKNDLVRQALCLGGRVIIVPIHTYTKN